jgi:hypothetical protein
MKTTSVAPVACVLAVMFTGCKSTPKETPSSPAIAPVLVPSNVPSALAERRVLLGPIPQGPALLIEPGLGFGPVRLGATVATIERLMESPCDQREKSVCRYAGRGIEFVLNDQDVTTEMRAYRVGRPAPTLPAVYGVFRGHTVGGLAPLMLQSAVLQLYGKPLKVQPVTDGGDAHTVEIYSYKGMNLQFDRMPSGSVVVGRIDIVKP